MVKILRSLMDEKSLKAFRKLSLGDRFVIADIIYRENLKRRKK